MSEQATSPDSLFEIGKLYSERCDFQVAIKKLKKASELYLKSKKYSEYLKTINLLLRMYAEMELVEEVDDTKEKLQDLVLKEKVSLTSKTYYTLALCASYKEQYKTALEYLEKSLALALSNDNKEDTCYAINGLAIVYKSLGRNEDALKEIYNLQVFFQVIPMPDIEISSGILNGIILMNTGQLDRALDIFWQCYDKLKLQKNLYMYIILLRAMGSAYKQRGDKDLARMYLTLAKRAADPENLVRFSRVIAKDLEDLGEADISKYDLIFKATSNAVLEKKKGKIDFKNQFILLDMLKLFLRHPGQVYSKEDLVQNIWRQDYDPRVHDNKIYVTIKRLRKLIEPDYDKPRYIFRAKNGYFLNKDTRILLEQ